VWLIKDEVATSGFANFKSFLYVHFTIYLFVLRYSYSGRKKKVMAFDNEKHRRDQGAFHRPTGIVVPLEELRPLTQVGEGANNNGLMIVATVSGNTQDNNNGENNDGFNNNKGNISYTAKKNFSQGEN
jgi:hypothetical protein